MQIRTGMRSSWLAAVAVAVATGLLSLFPSGCGGGGTPLPGSTPTPVGATPTPTPLRTAAFRVQIDWGARSRVVGLSSAQSARITLAGGAASGADLTWTVNRPSGTAATTQTYDSPSQARVGNSVLTIRFFTEANAGGVEVGLAQASASVLADGSLTVTISTYTGVQSVEIIADGVNNSVHVGQTKDLAVTARNAQGNTVAVTPGSVFFSVVQDPQNLAVVTGGSQIQGIHPISALVTARIDTATSAPTLVKVTSDAAVAVAPTSVDPLPWENSVTLVPTVTGAPAAERGVTWTIQNNPGDGSSGTVSSAGVYKAPKLTTGTPLTVNVVATSIYDTTKSAIVAITVRSLASVDVTLPSPLSSPFPISVGRTQQFNFAVVNGQMNAGTGLDQTVDLTLTGPAGEANTGNRFGTLTKTGFYTAPLQAPSSGLLCKITAVSVYAGADPTRNREVPIKVIGGSLPVDVN